MSSVWIAPEHPTVDLRLTRWAVLAVFFLNGVGIASWAAHIPDVKQQFGLSDAVLGLALLSIAVGSVGSLVLGGQLVARFGSRDIILVGEFGFCLALALLLVVPSFSLLILTMICFGACIGAMEVAANVQAFGVEERYHRPIMSTFHAFFSVGGLLGAGVASLVTSWGVSPGLHLLGVAFGLTALAVVGKGRLLSLNRALPRDSPTIALPTGPLLTLGVLAFLSLVAEGAMADWSAVYLRTTIVTSPSFAAAGYAAFSLAMAIGRLSGDSLRSRVRAVPLVRLSGLLGAVGLGLVLLVGQPLVALVGFACVGLGLSNTVPILFTAAGRTPGVATGTGIAAVATVGYFGFLVGPPVIGFVAQLGSLRVGLGLVAFFMALIAVLASGAARADLAHDGRSDAPSGSLIVHSQRGESA